MGLFGNPRKNKAKWAQIVMDKASTEIDDNLTEDELIRATTSYIYEHQKIFLESYNIVMTTDDAAARKKYLKQAQKHWSALVDVKPYCDKGQKSIIDTATDFLMDMEDLVKHPNRAKIEAQKNLRKQKKEDLWDIYAEMEMIDIFAGDDDK